MKPSKSKTVVHTCPGWVLTLAAFFLMTGCASPAAPAAGSTEGASTQTPALTPGAGGAQATATVVVPVTGEGTATGEATGLQFTLVEGKSEARYRVREQLVKRDLPSDAVGKTDQVTGSIVLNPDGSIDQANSKFTVDVSTLTTDEQMRDNYVRRRVLQTDQFPTVTFVPTSVSGLPNPLPDSGPVNFQMIGDLTIRDVTKPVTWTVTGNVENGQASGTATTSFKFEDFNLNQPQVPVVLSVEDNITLELDLTVQRMNP